jgi:hypothetical protein
MRSRETIEREIYQAREDLEARLNELRQAVQDKADVKARARVAIQQRKQQARELLKRGAVSTRRITRERPFLVGGIAAGVLLVSVATVLLVRRYGRSRYLHC